MVLREIMVFNNALLCLFLTFKKTAIVGGNPFNGLKNGFHFYETFSYTFNRQPFPWLSARGLVYYVKID